MEVECNDPLDLTCVPVSEESATCPEYSYIPIYKYDIEVPKSISSYSWTFAEPVATGTGSLLTMKSAETLGFPSNPPLEGSYVIKCYNTDDLLTPIITEPMNYNAGTWEWTYYISEACPTLRNKFVVQNTYWPYWYKVDGLNFRIWFKDIHVDLPQFEIIVNDQDYYQRGKEPLYGGGMAIENTITQQKGKSAKNLYYPFIPFEWLYTYEETPQVLAEIEGLPAVCKNLDCSYTYEANTAEVTSMSVNAASLEVTITGTNLPADIDQVSVGDASCQSITSNDGSSLVCTLDSPCQAGDHEPVVKSPKGLIPNASGFSKYTVPLVVTSVSPSDSLNPAGGDRITILGSGFPSRITATDFRVEFDDGTLCQLETC